MNGQKNGNGNVKGNVETKLTNRQKKLFHLALEGIETQCSADITSKINNINTLKSEGESLK